MDSTPTRATSTVIGPEDELAPSSILIPPKLKSNTDKLQWREAVRDWALNLKACAKGGDNRAKGAAASLGMTLYRSLEFNKKELVKKALRTGELVLNPESGGEDQMLIVEKIVNIVAKDSAVDTIKRMVRLNKEVHSCARKTEEPIADYIERFSGPAQAYLNLVNADQDSADSQNFAIVLRVNARVSSQTFTNLVSSLVSTAKLRPSASSRDITLAEPRVSKVVELLKSSKNDTDLDDHRESFLNQTDECINALTAAINVRKQGITHSELNSFIGLQDAVTVLEEAGLEEKDLEQEESKKKTEAPEKTGTMMAWTGNYGKFRNKRKNYWRTQKRYNKPEDHEDEDEDESEVRDLREKLTKKRKPDYNSVSKKRVPFDSSRITHDQDISKGNSKQYFQ